jgi:hypothetical protein
MAAVYPGDWIKGDVVMASNFQIVSVILLVCFISSIFGWTVRDMKGNRIKRFKVKRRKYRLIRYEFNSNVVKKVWG